MRAPEVRCTTLCDEEDSHDLRKTARTLFRVPAGKLGPKPKHSQANHKPWLPGVEAATAAPQGPPSPSEGSICGQF